MTDTAPDTTAAGSSPADPFVVQVSWLIGAVGGKDQLVDVASVVDYVARLQGLNKPVSLLLDPDEGHNARKPLFKQAYGYLLQRMGHEHLAGPAPAPPSVELAAYLKQMAKVNGAMKGL